jgi:hypothetical protein
LKNTIAKEMQNTDLNRELWTELDDNCSEKINGGFTIAGINVNVDTNIQTNIAVVVGNNPLISQFSSYSKK